ncbi:hypothetical protein H3C61_02885 [Candidatus Gracilibacteria bacterium]|nr:hypothetical protein [Candidatus Gracilibacteria bacterium]
MKEFLKNAIKGLTIGIFSILGVLLVVYAAGEISKLNDTKTSGSTLTLTSWNNLVNKVDELVDKVNAQPVNQGGSNIPTEISPEQPAAYYTAAIGNCLKLDKSGKGWRLPTINELALFVGKKDIDGNNFNNVYSFTATSIPYGDSNSNYWILYLFNLYNGNYTTTYPTNLTTYTYRCVR